MHVGKSGTSGINFHFIYIHKINFKVLSPSGKEKLPLNKKKPGGFCLCGDTSIRRLLQRVLMPSAVVTSLLVVEVTDVVCTNGPLTFLLVV